MQIILIDILLHGILYYSFMILEFVLLSPIAIIGLIIEYSRSLLVKLKRKFLRPQLSTSPKTKREFSPTKMFAEDNRPPYLVIVRVSELLLKEKPLLD